MLRSALGIVFVGAVGIIAVGCAAGKSQCEGSGCHAIEHDMAGGVVGSGADMAAPDDLAPTPPPPDMTPLLPFGSSCTDNSQCDSGICLSTADGGQYCTQTCTDTCPTGYGCYPVTGVLQPGVATNVCAPENNLLCTSCTSDSDCGAASGADHCMTYPTGTFCARDCSVIGCPATYDCVTVAAGDAGTLHQCVPTNNACDCTAASNGRTIKCTIMTGQGTSCPGVSTCNGATGWGACVAPSTTDTPDDTFTDSNCDGIDGDLENAIFVDVVTGNDANAGTIAQPVATINQGIALAKAKSLVQVLVSKGSYGPVTLSSGINIYGGYDAASQWQRASTNTTFIGGGTPAVDGNFITKETHVELFSITGTQQGWLGGSSYGVRITNSSGPVVLRTSTITAVDGQPGWTGSDGSGGYGSDNNPQGYNYSGMPGNTNSDGSGNYGRGGDGGRSACGSNGGSGGYAVNGDNGGASGGGAGPSAASAGSVGGGPSCNAGNWPSCDCGHGANPGTGRNGPSGGAGSNGIAAANTGTLSNSDYVVASGGSGANGIDGTGASGGGAGGGSTGNTPWYEPSCDTDEGGAGGGGGAGGCHGSLGTGGGGGGASFAVLSISSTVTVDKCTLNSGNGGAGGKGGNGGKGGQGGSYGSAGGGTTDDGDGQPGANGGTGGTGGPGGSGAGGSGGPSASIAGFNSNVTNKSSTLNHGSGGAQGPGGFNGASPAPNGSNGASAPILYF